jgi:hypothetical protein
MSRALDVPQHQPHCSLSRLPCRLRRHNAGRAQHHLDGFLALTSDGRRSRHTPEPPSSSARNTGTRHPTRTKRSAEPQETRSSV